MYIYLFLLGFVSACWHRTMPVGIVSDSWTGTRWPPSHVAKGLPVAPSAESPVPAGCMLSDQGCCALWNVGEAMAGRQVVSRDCRGLLLADVPAVPSSCFEDGWSWGKNALPARSSCVGFPLLSIVTYVIEVFAQLPAETQVFPASFVFLNEAV